MNRYFLAWRSFNLSNNCKNRFNTSTFLTLKTNTVKATKYFLILSMFALLPACDSGGGDSPMDDPDPVPGCTDQAASNYNTSATEDDCSCLYDGFTAIGAAPATAERNVIIEEFTGEWCGWCVDGTVRIEELMHQYPGRVFTTAIHQGDFLENSASQSLLQKFDVSFFPSGIVDRKNGVLGRDLWEGRAILGMDEVAKADVAIETQVNGGTLEGVVHVDFKENLGSDVYYVSVFINENGIEAVAQQNYYSGLNGAENHPYYSLASVLSGSDFIHNYVLRKHVGDFKIAAKAISGEGVFTRKFTTDISSHDAQNVQVIALVSNQQLFGVLNVNAVMAGGTVDWE